MGDGERDPGSRPRLSRRTRVGRIWLVAALSVLAMITSISIAVFLGPLRGNSIAGSVFWVAGSQVLLFAVAVFALRKAPEHPTPRRLQIACALFAVQTAIEYAIYALHDRDVAEEWRWLLTVTSNVLSVLSLVVITRLLALLPDGRYHFTYERRILSPLWAFAAVPALMVITGSVTFRQPGEFSGGLPPADTPLNWADWLAEPLGVLFFVSDWMMLVGVGLVLVRYRLLSVEHQRALRWLLVAGVFITFMTSALAIARQYWPALESETLLGGYLFVLPFFLLIVAIVIATFRYRLLDVDVVLRRSVVYGALWTLIGLAYVGLATLSGLGTSDDLPVTLTILVTVIATIALAPLRRWLNRVAERRVYGERLTGYDLLVTFGTTLEHIRNPPDLAAQLVRMIVDGLGLTWARVRLEQGQIAAAGSVTGEPVLVLPMRYGDDELGAIECGSKVEGRYEARDHELLQTLARQAALAVHDAQLNAELLDRLSQIEHQAEELSASRARIVQAQNTERRRIERVLHDGIQQEIVALVARMRLARNQLARDPARAEATLAEMQEEVYRIIDELREFAHGIHPPVLTDEGLVAAVESGARRLPIPVRVSAVDGVRTARYSSEVEESAFFFVSEALTNVLKHADAHQVVITIAQQNGDLMVEVGDDGVGFDAESGNGGGSGLTGLRDRIEAVGGELRISSAAPTGTTLRARMPATERAR